jgi:Zn-dependent M28 family amino/carboxypeptidase
MSVTTYRTTEGGPPEGVAGTRSVRFGDEVVVSRDEAGARRGVGVGELYLVVQNGRLFQDEHPDVPVVVDKGRFLLVELSPERAGAIGHGAEPCYGVQPIEDGMVAFDVGRAAARAPVAWIQALADRVSAASFRADLTRLVEFRTRFSTGAEYTRASIWARQQLAALGYSARRRRIAVGSRSSWNVIADRRGAGLGTRGLVLVTAHLDSINLSGGPAAPAPGADDNGSGSAGLLEIARALRDHRAVHDLRLVLFGGEEEGLHGSRQYVAGLSAAQRARIRAVVNMDMVGTRNTPAPSVLLEGAQVSQGVIDGLAEAAATYTGLAVQTSLNPFNSDHVPFIDAGLPAVLTIEGADGANGNIHSARDTLDRVDMALALEILRMNTAFVAGLIGRA